MAHRARLCRHRHRRTKQQQKATLMLPACAIYYPINGHHKLQTRQWGVVLRGRSLARSSPTAAIKMDTYKHSHIQIHAKRTLIVFHISAAQLAVSKARRRDINKLAPLSATQHREKHTVGLFAGPHKFRRQPRRAFCPSERAGGRVCARTDRPTAAACRRIFEELQARRAQAAAAAVVGPARWHNLTLQLKFGARPRVCIWPIWRDT